ncbi:MAG: DNA polymerase III subunit alpha, partial [Erysipelotrichales bacterium]|nr:DNA polymerase III subunit alpha [Erysipelotrichales bacterium]
MAVLLYNRTTYSFLQSALKVEDLFAYAQKEGFHAVGIADQRVLYGFAKAREYEKKTGIHVVYGLEVQAAYEDRVLPFVVFAKNDDGYRVLCRLSEKAQKEKAPLDINRIGELSRDLVCVLPDKGLEDLLYAADEEALENILRYFSNAVSSVYVGKGNASSPLYKRGNEILDALCRKYHLPCAAFPLGLYKPGDLDLYKAVQAIDQEVTIDDRYLRFDKNTVLKTAEELREYTEEEVFNSERIAALCKVTLEDRKASLPDYPCPHGADPKEYLRSLAAAGLKKRLNGKVTKEYSDRLRYELDTIVRMGFADYFLIVYGMILFARRNGITLGPGRGSAPGSLIAYCLGITHVDPIKYGLLFERFLNPMRHTMPDIDTDVPDNKREDFIRYLCDTYGEEHVSHIIAFTTYGARQTLTDLGRVLKIPAGMLDTVRKLLPKGPKITLQKAYSTSEAFRRYIESSAELRSLYAIGCRLEGFQRNVTTHAAGIVLSKEKVRDIIPLHYEEGKLPSTQYTMEYLEPLGLIKFDILGVINLTVIHQTLETVRKEEPEIDLFKISYEDPEVYAVFSR